ncbi:MAG: hypothetical protein RIF41_25690, partial [Polyangiaceae bacterium]
RWRRLFQRSPVGDWNADALCVEFMLHEAARPGAVQSFWIMADLVLHRLRAMRRRLHELRRELDVAIREAARLADEQPDGPEFVEALEVVESVGARLAAT